MKKIKFILPMLAFILAIGMSFAINRSNEPVATDEVIIYQGQPIEVNVGCQGDMNICEVQLTDDSGNPILGEIYPVLGLDSNGEYTVELRSSSDKPFNIPLSTLDN